MGSFEGSSDGKVSACIQETQVRSLGWEDLLEKEMATHSSIPAWRIPGKEEPGRLHPWVSKESDTTEQLHFTSLHFTSAFLIVQLSHPYITTRKIIALTRRTFVGKVMSLLCNMLSRLVMTFLPRSTSLLIS